LIDRLDRDLLDNREGENEAVRRRRDLPISLRRQIPKKITGVRHVSIDLDRTIRGAVK
jgi:hypothetical protein